MKITFWIRVQSLLKAYKMTQADLAEQIGVSYNTLRGWIYNNRYPDIYSAYKIAIIFGVGTEYLVMGKCKPGANQKKKPLNAPLPDPDIKDPIFIKPIENPEKYT